MHELIIKTTIDNDCAAMMTYKTAYASHQVQKMVHGGLHLIGLVLGIVGISAAFRFHDKLNLKDMVSLHSWIGLTTFILLGLQVNFSS